MFMAGNELTGFWAGGGGIQLVPCGSNGTSGFSSSWNFTGVDIGAPAADRLLIVAAGIFSSLTFNVSSIQRDGNNMTSVADVNSSDSNRVKCIIYRQALATGSTADFDFNLSANTLGIWFKVYALYGYQSATPTDTQTDTSGDPLTFTLTIPQRGIGLAIGAANGGTTSSWSGLTVVDGNGSSVSTASLYSGGGVAASVSWDHDGTTREAMAGAAWN